MPNRSTAQIVATNGQLGGLTARRNSAAQLTATRAPIPDPTMPVLPDSSDAMAAATTAIAKALLDYVTLATAQTITGLKTFNRGAAAPFAVDAASLLVQYLNADKLDGKDEAAFAGIAEAETINGLWTYNRGAAVPFAVDAASLLVTNLDADKWDGQEYSEDSFTVTGTGFTVNPTGTARYTKAGKIVTLYIPALDGTSNDTTFTLTGLPAELTPTRAHSHLVFARDNSVQQVGLIQTVIGSTTLDLYTLAAGNAWVAGGLKTLYDCVIPYALL
jgi:hypothetical protein